MTNTQAALLAATSYVPRGGSLSFVEDVANMFLYALEDHDAKELVYGSASIEFDDLETC